ncbi:thiamine phosphate synthase [Pelagibacteraceae bacterium]|nr:thiamine phosphate synthase [Pelagibacteraceae bacterium]
MIKKNFKLFFFIEKLNELNLDYVKKIGAILILRNPEKVDLIDLIKFDKRCINKKITLFIQNSVKILFLLKTNNFYISAYNKSQFKQLRKINRKVKIIGSAHNIPEIYEKLMQGCDYIILSRIFKTSNKFKKGFLGTTKFNLLTKNFSNKFVALGGINEKNFRSLNLLNIYGCAMSGDKKKAGKYMPAFLKNNF